MERPVVREWLPSLTTIPNFLKNVRVFKAIRAVLCGFGLLLRQQGLESGSSRSMCQVRLEAEQSFDTGKCKRGQENVCLRTIFVSYILQLGSDKRVLGFMKLKHGNKEAVSILEFGGTKIDQFRYVGKGNVKDIGLPQTKEESGDVKRGRFKSKYSLEEVMGFYNKVQAKECTYKDIERDYGISRSAIRKRVCRARVARDVHG